MKATTDQTPALLLTRKQACEHLNLGTSTLQELTLSHAIPSHKLGRRRLYDPDELRAWIRAGCPTAPNSADKIRGERRA